MKWRLIALAALLSGCSTASEDQLETRAGYLVVSSSEFHLFANADDLSYPGNCLSFNFADTSMREQSRVLAGQHVRVSGHLVEWPSDALLLELNEGVLTNHCFGQQVMIAEAIEPIPSDSAP